MKKLLSTLAAALIAAPALAHPGAHVHPHGDVAVPVLAGLALVAAAAYLWWRAR
jgi:hypothetical protein